MSESDDDWENATDEIIKDKKTQNVNKTGLKKTQSNKKLLFTEEDDFVDSEDERTN